MPALSLITHTHPPSELSRPALIDRLARHWGLTLVRWADVRASRLAERRTERGRDHYRRALVEAEADRARADARTLGLSRTVR